MTKNCLEDYEISKLIGTGTFSEVKMGINKETKEKVAIKILEKTKIKSINDTKRIKREISILNKTNHLNVIKTIKIEEDKDRIYFIMEYCEGGELFDFIVKKRNLNEGESAYFYYQLINGIEYIHSINVAHRDLKPENLLLTKGKILKIVDFGLSNFFYKDQGQMAFLRTPCGSPCYASPEMVSGYPYSGSSIDVWSSGIILFAMLCGYLPFEDENNDELFKKILNVEAVYPDGLSERGVRLLKKLLEKDPEKRINIEGIKKDEFYLLGQRLFNEKHPELALKGRAYSKPRKMKSPEKLLLCKKAVEDKDAHPAANMSFSIKTNNNIAAVETITEENEELRTLNNNDTGNNKRISVNTKKKKAARNHKTVQLEIKEDEYSYNSNNNPVSKLSAGKDLVPYNNVARHTVHVSPVKPLEKPEEFAPQQFRYTTNKKPKKPSDKFGMLVEEVKTNPMFFKSIQAPDKNQKYLRTLRYKIDEISNKSNADNHQFYNSRNECLNEKLNFSEKKCQIDTNLIGNNNIIGNNNNIIIVNSTDIAKPINTMENNFFMEEELSDASNISKCHFSNATSLAKNYEPTLNYRNLRQYNSIKPANKYSFRKESTPVQIRKNLVENNKNIDGLFNYTEKKTLTHKQFRKSEYDNNHLVYYSNFQNDTDDIGCRSEYQVKIAPMRRHYPKRKFNVEQNMKVLEDIREDDTPKDNYQTDYQFSGNLNEVSETQRKVENDKNTIFFIRKVRKSSKGSVSVTKDYMRKPEKNAANTSVISNCNNSINSGANNACVNVNSNNSNNLANLNIKVLNNNVIDSRKNISYLEVFETKKNKRSNCAFLSQRMSAMKYVKTKTNKSNNIKITDKNAAMADSTFELNSGEENNFDIGSYNENRLSSGIRKVVYEKFSMPYVNQGDWKIKKNKYIYNNALKLSKICEPGDDNIHKCVTFQG